MALSIRNAETDRLVRELALATGEDLTDAVTIAVRERLDRIRAARSNRTGSVFDDLMRIARAAPMPIDSRPLDELVTDDDWGIAD